MGAGVGAGAGAGVRARIGSGARGGCAVVVWREEASCLGGLLWVAVRLARRDERCELWCWWSLKNRAWYWVFEGISISNFAFFTGLMS